MSEASLKRTPLYALHVAAGARTVPFAGWEMPVQYAGVLQEVRAVREAAGLFDVSHMGELHVTGPAALAWLNSLATNDVARLAPGRAQYSLLCREDGGIVDDILVYQLDTDDFMLVTNASNTEKDARWLQERLLPGVELTDSTAETALLALQGPAAAEILGGLTVAPVADLRRFQFGAAEVAGVPCLVSRTGYTGGDGFELFTQEDAAALWRALLEAEGGRVQPCGLGARDVCRIEAGNVLYDHEIDEHVNPVAAGLMWVVRLEKGAFLGSDAIARIQAAGVPLTLIGLKSSSRAVPRQDYLLFWRGEEAGFVTSGTFSPTLGKPIALGYLPPEAAAPGTEVEFEIRSRREPAVVVSLPFYRAR
ncbi:MAG: glycine cleavage system aminomethyltransferase GcvT [Armatimonadetes bacterium]|nr:glycine cleavage system aminomethyltransferase GcvT [Armatimonadota bacterium]